MQNLCGWDVLVESVWTGSHPDCGIPLTVCAPPGCQLAVVTQRTSFLSDVTRSRWKLCSHHMKRRPQLPQHSGAKLLLPEEQHLWFSSISLKGASLVAQLVKNLPAVWETRVQFLGWEDPLEKGMAIHCSILAWTIPWTVQPVGWQRGGYDWATSTFTFTLQDSISPPK